MFNLFRLCRKDKISFDIVAETGNFVAKNGNNVEATFDIVEIIVQLVAFDNVAWTLLLVWTGLKSLVDLVWYVYIIYYIQKSQRPHERATRAHARCAIEHDN